jgi:hypothetical protein
MKVRIKHVIVCMVLTFALPLTVQGQEFERISLGGKVVVWSVPDLDGFWVALDGLRGTERHEIDDNVLYGVRPFLRVGLIRQLALELSHEFAFGDNADIMVTSGTGIWRPFSSSGLELHASICYGQLDWDGPGNFDSTWGWEAGGGYSFKLFDSVNLVLGVAYRDLSFDYEVDELLLDLVETRPDVATVRYSRDSVDPSGLVADIGIFVTF